MAAESALSRWARLGLVGVVAATVAQGSGLAERAYGQAQQPGQPARAADASEEVQGPIINLEFPGGTLREYIAAVQRAAGQETVNVLVPAEAANLPLPPISMKQVSARTALEALRWAFPQRSPHVVRIVPVGGPGSVSPTFAVEYVPTGIVSASGATPPPDRVDVLSIRDLIDPADGGAGLPVEALLTSVEAALALNGTDRKPELRFHEASGLLIVRGTVDQIDIVRDLVDEIQADTKRRRVAARERAQREAEEQFHKRRLDIEIELQERELRAAKEHAARMEQALRHGQASADMVQAAKLEEARQEARMRTLQVERERPGAGRSAARTGTDADEVAELKRTIEMLQMQINMLQAELARAQAEQAKPR